MKFTNRGSLTDLPSDVDGKFDSRWFFGQALRSLKLCYTVVCTLKINMRPVKNAKSSSVDPLAARGTRAS
jgi:hypothetical protein